MKKLLPFIILTVCAACTLDNIDKVVECTKEGETRYYTSEGGLCVSQKCVDKVWILDDSEVCGNVSCKKVESGDTFACGECLNNAAEYQFIDTVCTKRVCESGLWTEYFIEKDNILCGLCEDGETRYYPAENGTCVKQKCVNKNWVIDSSESCGLVSCASVEISIEDKDHSYYICGECLNNTIDYSYQNKTCYKRNCDNGKWSAPSLESNLELCICKENTSKYLNDDNICKKYDCISGADVEDKSFNCINSCSKDFTGCGECKNDEVRFIDIDNKCMREVCMSGTWTKTDNYICDNSCVDISEFDNNSHEELLLLSCGECLNGTNYYRNDENGFCKKYNCEIGKLVLSNEEFNCTESCNPSPANDSNGACGVCHNGDIRFDNQNNICKRSICKDGVWVTDDYYGCTKTCKQEGLSEGGTDQCGECVNDNELFINDEFNLCKKQICHNGTYQWAEESDCLNSCSDNGCGECLNGSTRCSNDGNAIETCMNGRYTFTVKCPTSCKERDGYASCQATCNGNETKCTNMNNIGIKSVCQDGVALEAPCQGSVLCASDKECGECQFGESFCENSTIKTCRNGKWEISTCPNGNSCDDSNQCGVCQDGNEVYSDLPNQNCQRYRCIQGRWESQELCKNNVSCSDNGCGNCKNYSFSTNDKELQTCINGKKESNEECLKQPFSTDRFINLGEYTVCKYKTILGVSSNENDKINCYNTFENGKHIGYMRNDDTPCNSNSPVSCHVKGVNETECGECLELDTRCNNKLPQTCINGKWTTDLPEWHTADRCAEQ